MTAELDNKMFNSGELDLVERDPKGVNEHLRVAWDDIIAEPDGGHSHPCLWKCSFNCFMCAKTSGYYILTFLCSWWMAFLWGCEFAEITFWHVWYYTPQLKMCQINCGLLQKFWHTGLHCCLGPLCETCGLCFSKINVENRSA